MEITLANIFKEAFSILLKNENIRTSLLNTNNNVTQSKTAEEKLNIFIEEAEVTLGLLDLKSINKNSKLLEVGAGIGLCYVYLQNEGYNVTGIEPAGSNIYSEYQIIANEFFNITHTDTSQWHSYRIEETEKLNYKYDLIFSNFVLEHVDDTESALLDLHKLLVIGGKMIHNTVNYNVPFEPHLNLILFPIWPEYTARLLPYLQKNSLWQTLNFISYSEVKRISNKHGLNCTFSKHTTFNYLERLIEDSEFRKRKKSIYRVYIILKKVYLVYLIKHLPTRYNTPLTFSILKNGK